MAYTNLPVSISIIRAVTEQTERILPSFKKGNHFYDEFKSIVREASILTVDSRFLASELHIIKLQIFMFLALSMYGGVVVPSIKQLHYSDHHVRLTWDSGITDKFTFGVYDDDFKAFSKYFQTRLSSRASGTPDVPNTIIRGVSQFLRSDSENHRDPQLEFHNEQTALVAF